FCRARSETETVEAETVGVCASGGQTLASLNCVGVGPLRGEMLQRSVALSSVNRPISNKCPCVGQCKCGTVGHIAKFAMIANDRRRHHARTHGAMAALLCDTSEAPSRSVTERLCPVLGRRPNSRHLF